MGQIEGRLEEVAKVIRSDQDAAALRLHVEEVLESPSFSSSRRSGQFLQYVVEKAISQEIQALKERTIGIEVFRRQPNYDTGEDAVVRVTASDVRRRLAQHYSREGRASEFKISLPPGSYAPEICRDPPPHRQLSQAQSEPSSAPSALPAAAAVVPTESAVRSIGTRRGVPFALVALASVALFAAGAYTLQRQWRQLHSRQQPWALLFSQARPLFVVLSDPDLNEIQLLTGKSVSVSDYANGRLGCETLAPVLQPVCTTALRGDKVPAIDAAALAKIAALAASFNSSIEPHAAREIRLTDLKTDRNMLFLGSRRANPWTDLFREKLDFFVTLDEPSGLQVVRNPHPRPGEATVYMPTAGPQGTGENYSVISFVSGLGGAGHAMLLAGATHEGTDAAVALVTDRDRFAKTIADCRLPSASSNFQVLLKLRMMVGSPLTTEVVTCHALPV